MLAFRHPLQLTKSLNKSVSSYEIQKIRRLEFQTSLVEQIKIICLQEDRGFQQAILLVMELLLLQ